MFKHIEEHSVIRAYRSDSAAWQRQTYSIWVEATDYFAHQRKSKESNMLAAGQSFCMGQASRKQEFYDQAVRSFQMALDFLPDWPLAIEALALTYHTTGRRKETQEYLSKALRLDAELIHSRIAFAELFCEKHNYKAAEDVLKLALRYQPSDAGIYWRLGHIALSDLRLKEAFEAYEQAIRVNPFCTEAFIGKSCVRLMEQDYNSALDFIKLALKHDDTSSEAYINLAIIYHNANRLVEAEEAFSKAITLAPRSAKNYFRIALFYWNINSKAKAERYLRIALNCDDLRSHYYSALGLLMLEYGRIGEAESCFRQALLINSDDLIALHGLTIISWLDGRGDEAEALKTHAKSILKAGKRSITSEILPRLHPKLF
ncbi:MAG: tetratricopeptide repeat protein [Blastocatellia bacterium]|nr:tetratricopeptide repeat protein [Blastocatellia bacterium]